jgi:hypothetical protein
MYIDLIILVMIYFIGKSSQEDFCYIDTIKHLTKNKPRRDAI